jgi:4-alpha-glucanotransferase
MYPQNTSHAAFIPRFGRQFTTQEWQGYGQTINEAKQLLGKDRLALITPIRSLPVNHQDTGVGSLLGAKAFFEFAKRLGFCTFQLDPAGKTKKSDASPYTGTVYSLNPLYVFLAPLAEDKQWAGILTGKDIEDTIANAPQNLVQQNRVPYKYMFDEQDKLLLKAYRTFDGKRQKVDTLPTDEAPAVRELNRRFEQYVSDNQSWLEADALYEALSQEYNNDYWPNWDGPNALLDRQLMCPSPDQAQNAEARRLELKKTHTEAISAYQFAQFVWNEQKREFLDFAKTNEIKMMADRQVGFSDRDIWANQHLFLKDESLGCPPDYFSKDGQAWGFPMLDPDQLFLQDGSLGEGGKLLQRLFNKILDDFPDGFRVDHIIGLIDPWVYRKGSPVTSPEKGNGGRLFSSPENPTYKRYAKVQESDLDLEEKPDAHGRVLADAMTPEKVKTYATIIEKIILPALDSRGLPHSALIAEDLGTLTNPVEAVMKQFTLSGIRVSQFVNPAEADNGHRGKNVEPHSWFTDGTHDNASTFEWSQRLKDKDRLAHATILAEDLIPNEAERPAFVEKITSDLRAFTKAKMTEVFASPAKNVQVFFTNWLGMDTTYNVPGTKDDNLNWSLRIPKDYESYYFEQVKQDKALNLPEVMKQALEARGTEVVQQNQDLLDRLDKFSKILKAEGA